MQRFRTEIGLLLACVAVVVVTHLVSGAYGADKAERNVQEVIRKASILGTFALGAGVVIIAGGIDLSAGSVIALSATVFASVCFAFAPLDEFGQPATESLSTGTLMLAMLAVLAVALAIGAFHAWLITAVRLPPFVATLASLVGLRSIAQLLVRQVDGSVRGAANGRTKISIADETFAFWGTDYRVPLIAFAVFAIGLAILLRLTVAGRHVYAVGGNEEAARLSGIRTDRVKWLVYTISSVTAAAAGVLYGAYAGVASPGTLGLGYELNAIAAAVVGGCALTGGLGSVTGMALGALFLVLVIDLVAKVASTGQFAVSQSDFEGSVVGLLVILAVAVNQLRQQGGARMQLFAGPLGLIAIGLLTALVGLMALLLSRGDVATTTIAALVTLGLCVARCLYERRSRAS